MKIVIFENNLIFSETVKQQLESKNMTVECFRSSLNAKEYFSNNQVDLILSSVKLIAPTEGFDLLKYVKWELKKSIPFIILNCTDSKYTEREMLTAGAMACFPRPLDYQALFDTISKIDYPERSND